MDNEMSLFEAYYKGEMTSAEAGEFERRLSSDKEFALDFETYVRIIRENRAQAAEEDMDFGVAMKHLSREELLNIIGVTNDIRGNRVSAMMRKEIDELFDDIRASVRIDEPACAYFESGFDEVEIYPEETSEEERFELAEDMCAPTISHHYMPCEEKEDKGINILQDEGIAKAMNYFHTNEPDHAREVLEQLMKDYPDDEAFIARCRRMLDGLEDDAVNPG